jgi:hypothetical protein
MTGFGLLLSSPWLGVLAIAPLIIFDAWIGSEAVIALNVALTGGPKEPLAPHPISVSRRRLS